MSRRRTRVTAAVTAPAMMAAVFMGVTPVSRVAAQTTAGTCAASSFGGFGGADACTKARDIFALVMPQVGVALAGGNPLLGEGGTLGGWGKRALAVRVTAVDGYVPANAVPLSLTGAASSNLGATRAPVPVPSADAAIGLFAGVPAGLTNVGGVDVLLGVTYLPEVNERDFAVAPQASSLALSYGVRVGALQESSLVPGVSISYTRRKMPTTSLRYVAGNDSITVSNLAATANSLRLVVSKRVAIFGIAGGVGRDQFENTAGVEAVVNEAVLGQTASARVQLSGLRNAVTRNTAFVNLSLGLGIARLVGEVGWSAAGQSDPTTNTFDDRLANEGYRYGSLGLTVRF